MVRKLSLFFVVAAAIAPFYGCEDGVTPPPPPPPPPSINLQLYSETASDPGFRLPNDDIFDIFIDSQNRTWFCTDAGVAMKDGSNPIQVFDDFDGIPNRRTRAAAELGGKIYVGTWGGGLGVYDGTPTWRKLTTANGLVDGQVSSIAADDSSVWVGTVNGLSQYIPARNVFVNHTVRLGASNVVSSVLVRNNTGRGPEIWLGTKGDGVTVVRIPSLHSVVGVLDSQNRPIVYAVGQGGSVMRLRTFATPRAWERVTSGTRDRLMAVWGRSNSAIHAVGANGRAIFFNGTSWSVRTTGTTATLRSIWGTATDNVWAVGDNGTVLRFGGTSWSIRAIGTKTNLRGIWGRSADEFYIVGDGGEIWKGNGRTFRRLPVAGSPNVRLNSVFGFSGSSVFAVGDNGAIIVSADGDPLDAGDNPWVAMPTAITEHLTSVWGSSPGNVYAGGSNGTIYRFDGVTWTPMATGAATTVTFNGIWGDATNNIYAVGGLSDFSAGPSRIFHFNGTAWNRMTGGTEQFLRSVVFNRSNSGIPGNDVTDLEYDPNTDVFWVSLATLGVASVDVDARVWKHIDQADGLVSDITHSVAVDRASTLWVGTQAGLTRRLAGGQVTNFVRGSGLPNERVRRVAIFPAGANDDVWLAFIEAGAGLVR